jgi:hypothetical protein
MSIRSAFIRLAAVAALAIASSPALATIDTFRVWHHSGACGDVDFSSGHMLWNGRSRINIASGERVHVRLYGHGADFATDASADGIHEWIFDKGRTTDYPTPPIYAGQKQPKGYVTIAIEAKPEHGTGNRTVTVKWPAPGQPETIPVRIVANCSSLAEAAYRLAPGTPTAGQGTINPIRPPPSSTVPLFANLLPSVQTPYVLARPLGAVVPTPAGGMLPVNAAFCANIPSNVVTQVPVPPLRWGVVGTNITLAAAGFNVQLVNDTDLNAPALLATQPLPAGFPANTPQVLATNYPGRPAAIRVIANPRFTIGSGTSQTYPGCFTAPGVTQPLDPIRFRLVVDPANTINEGSNENDNELTF